MGELRRTQVLIEGRVQGVYYRASLQRQAERRRVAGWVRNLEDGRVEAVLEGAASDVAELVEWCRNGPSGARVERLTTRELPAASGETGFRVLPTASGPAASAS